MMNNIRKLLLIFFILIGIHTVIITSSNLTVDIDTKFCQYCEPNKKNYYHVQNQYKDLNIKYEESEKTNLILKNQVTDLLNKEIKLEDKYVTLEEAFQSDKNAYK